MSDSQTDAANASKPGAAILQTLQSFGRSLMLPIAALPAAALLLRFGQTDIVNSIGLEGNQAALNVASIIGAGGNALFENLAILFAIGIAFGFAKKGDGSAALSGAVGYLVLTQVFKVMAPMLQCPGLVDEALKTCSADAKINYGVLAGIVAGLIAAKLWEKYHRIKLPDYLGFFAGRRFVPIIVSVVSILVAVVMAFVYPYFDSAITALGNAILENAVIGAGIFGVINRLLIPFGLHHILNSVVWFIQGSFTCPDASTLCTAGEVFHGDLHRFFAGDPNAGVFMTGFFPVMMFGLPGAAIAMWHSAKPENRKAVGGIMVSVAFTAFLTGITEPLEFSFMFAAPALYGVHALLTGTSMALTNALGIKHGFGFSGGALDFFINWNLATKPLLLLGIGVIYFFVYYFIFMAMIKALNLKTPGRGEGELLTAEI